MPEPGDLRIGSIAVYFSCHPAPPIPVSRLHDGAPFPAEANDSYRVDGATSVLAGVAVSRLPAPVRMPTLDQVAQDRAVLENLPAEVLIELRRQCRHLHDDLDVALLRSQARSLPAATEVERVVLVEEAARMLATSEDTLYSKWRHLPFAFKDSLDGKIKFRVAGIARYLAGRI